MRRSWLDVPYLIGVILFLGLAVWFVWLLVTRPADGPAVISANAAVAVVGIVFLNTFLFGFGVSEYFHRKSRAGPSISAKISDSMITSAAAGAFFFSVYGILLCFAPAIAIKYGYDRIDVVDTNADVNQSRSLVAEPRPVNFERLLGITLRSRPPFDVHLCRLYSVAGPVVPQRAEFFRVDSGQAVQRKAVTTFGQYWKKFDRAECLMEIFRLDFLASQTTRYCMDLKFVIAGEDRTERSCWDFNRAVGEETSTLSEIMESW